MGKGDAKDTTKGKGAGKGTKGPARSSGPSTVQITERCVMKFLAPESLASGIIGKGGAVIESIRTSCSAKLALTDSREFYPGTESRILTVQAEAAENLDDVCHQIVDKVAELAKGSSSEGADDEAELTIKTLVPRAAVGGIIGKGGAAVKQLRESTGAKISITDPIGSGPGAEQMVSIGGSAKALEDTLKEVNKQIQQLNSETWFQQWASSTGALVMGNITASLGVMGGVSKTSPSVELMMRVAQGLPSYVMEDSRGFALSCMVPNRLVGGVIGRGGAGTKEVQSLTGTKISVREIPGDEESRSLNIAGPLANTCSAYMLMMKRYLDAEASASGSSNRPAPGLG